MKALLLPAALVLVHAGHSLLGIHAEGIEQAIIAWWGSR